MNDYFLTLIYDANHWSKPKQLSKLFHVKHPKPSQAVEAARNALDLTEDGVCGVLLEDIDGQCLLHSVK